MSLENLRNLGPKSLDMLRAVGVEEVDAFRLIGVVDLYLMLRAKFPHVTLNLLWGLEGAAADIDWREISEERKNELLEAVK